MFEKKYVRAFFMFSAIMLLFWGIPFVANAETQPSDFEFDASTGTITKYIGVTTDVYIPDTINDIKVTSIGHYAFFGCSSLTSIIIPDNVTYIGYNAFYACNNLTSVNLPNSVTHIEANAFYGCTYLTNINIPNSVTYIGFNAFYECRNLTSVNLPNSITSIEDSTFSGCDRLTSINIPNSVSSIGDGAFEECSSLTSANIPNSVTSIGTSAFLGCSSLTSVNIPNSVISISNGAFMACSSLTNIIIPNNVTSIGDFAFARCNSLASISIPNSVTNIGSRAFDNDNYITIFVSEGYYAQTYAEFNKIPFRILTNIKINGAVEPELIYLPSSVAKPKADFKVEVIGQPISAYTDEYGNFELNVPNSIKLYDLKISKHSYLTKELKNISINQELPLSPISMWVGDINGDNAINMFDIMEVSKGFNSIDGDGRYIAECDFNKDGAINIIDIMIAAKHFNETSY